METITFDNLSPTEFENFCYDLLKSLKFTNINWRKGTGLESSPSDQGRDIECEYLQELVDGSKYIEKWFVECKQYLKGVPPDKLMGILSWAQAERPDKILIIVSNFLSNPAKEYLAKYQKNNRPPFKIVIWEKPKLLDLSSLSYLLLKKYGLVGEYPFLNIMHHSHIEYLKLPLPNTFEYFFNILEEVNPKTRDDMLSSSYHSIINPRYKKAPKDYKGTVGDLRIDKVDYSSFKQKCYELSQYLPELFIITAIVNQSLQYLLHLGDSTSMEKFIAINRYSISNFKKQIEEGKPDSDILASLITKIEEDIKTMPERIKKQYDLYIKFCEQVVSKLHLQKYNLEDFDL
jgi:hypothetical protein